MASFNRVILVGNLTRDVDLRYVSGGGTAVTELGLAVNDRRKTQSGEWVDETTFVDVTLWGRTAEIASEYLSKGSSVLIEGRLKLDTWETDGQKRSKLRVVGEKMQMLGGRDGGGGGSRSGGGPSRPARQSQPQGGGRGGYDQSSGPDYDSYDDGSFGGPGSQGAADDDIPF
ncbi:single-stranded DNA-binding protein [Blastopirellula marina]|uniref:Single-stranded DNA-binding protein n=1 Tax=Blastopirellula marina TaxID=124 RepID=A0A2S8FNX2_9BACT|nr:single-stranded DNA-binding protein [Blastopirellula marina]PQO33889.1 single-stranded DNA-binding protein [Blastopirellula marina]PTL43676.1 single-stranded DNA-binding protein [Blastopirellula marina]